MDIDMDKVKNKLMKLKKDFPDCTATRQRLRSILSDHFPTEKQLINAILNAYDEDVENRLKSSSDRTLSALQLFKVLKYDYGMTDSSALLAIESWCYILGYIEAAEALSGVKVSQQQAAVGNSAAGPQSAPCPQSTVDLGFGTYKAGVDFPAGEISLQVVGKKPKYKIWYCVSKKPNRIDANESFMDKTYVVVKEGEYLKLECDDNVIRVTKIS